MNVYVIEAFSRNDEHVEYGSEVIATYNDLKEAIKHARDIICSNMDHYKYGREDEPSENVKFYFCLDKDTEVKGKHLTSFVFRCNCRIYIYIFLSYC